MKEHRGNSPQPNTPPFRLISAMNKTGFPLTFRCPIFRWLILFSLLLVASSTAIAGNVQTDYDHKAVFERYHTYSWRKIKTSNPFYVSRIRDGVDHYLQGQGWQRIPTGGDISLFAISDVKNEQSLRTFYNGFGGGWGWGSWGGWGGPGYGGPGYGTTMAVNQRVRSVVIDMYDAKTRQLLWRGRAEQNLSDKTPKNVHRLYQDFAEMFHNFPPKS